MNLATAQSYNEDSTFFKIPTALLVSEKYRHLSAEAKILYALMYSRKNISLMNNWTDEKGRVYIYYTVKEITEVMGCSHTTAIKLLGELDTYGGIGLIERRKQGQGKPCMIFINNVCTEEADRSVDKSEPEKDCVEYPEVCTYENLNSGNKENGIQDINYPESNYIDNNNINNNYINRVISDPVVSDTEHEENNDMTGWIEQRKTIRETVRNNIDYIATSDTFGKEWVDEIVELMVEVICSREKFIRISKIQYPQEVVAERYLNIRSRHIENLYFTTRKITGYVDNIRAYMITAIYHSYETSESWIKARVSADKAREKA